MRCFACGVLIPDENRFCPYCGSNQSERPVQRKCAGCGHLLVPGARFCGNCGSDKNNPYYPVHEEAKTPIDITPEPIPTVEAEAPVQKMEPQSVPEKTTDQSAPAPAIPPAVESFPELVQELRDAVPMEEPSAPPAGMVLPVLWLPQKRSIIKMILLGLLTLGIYPFVVWCKMSSEINVVASRYDGKWTIHYLAMLILAPVTLLIYPFIWSLRLCDRISDELHRRKIPYKLNAAIFWLWGLLYPILGFVIAVSVFLLLPLLGATNLVRCIAVSLMALASLVGPSIYLHKHLKAMNLLNSDYNKKG